MITLRQEQKDLVLDYFFQCGTDVHLDSAKQLIESDPRAKDLYEQLKANLQHLDHVDHDAHAECPDHLAEITVNKLKVASSAENARLQTLLAEEGEKAADSFATPNDNIDITRFRSFWQNLPDVATVACVLLIVASVSFPTFNHMRSKARQIACSAGMFRVGEGIASYRNDNNDSLPAVATVAGDPWWKVGDQGQKNQSNTRHPWILVKNGYVDAADFVCPGRKDGVKAEFTKEQLQKLNDFPSRGHISYSFMFMCDKRAKRQWNGRTVIMADLNPIFEGVSTSSSREQFEELSIGDQLRNAMSSNHKKGQVILFMDGSAMYKKVRVISGDDIYTARDKTAYTGCEVPGDIQDIFLVP
ncbi:MAG: hypothetical protein K9M75_00780 [Phycisphaerae bacterium]|nr:hypothetical protein [Phycisphaerae bacterium]